MVRFGIIGTGMIARQQAESLSRVEGAELSAVLSRNSAGAATFAADYPCTPCSSMNDFLYKVDAVSVCSPAGVHLDSSLPVIEAGKHLIVEKPLEITVERGLRIVDAAERKGVCLAGIFQSRTHEGARAVKSAVEEGRFGRLTLGDACIKWYRSQEYYDRTDWKGTWKYDGGGALMNQGIHAVDLLLWFMGKVKSVQARWSVLGHSGIDVEDTAAAVLEFEIGALGIIEGSTAVYPGYLKKIEISGTAGTAILEEESIRAWSFADERTGDADIRARLGGVSAVGGAADAGAIENKGHQRQFEDFVHSIETGSKPLVDGIESLQAVAVIEAIYKSGRSGEMVKVEYP